MDISHSLRVPRPIDFNGNVASSWRDFKRDFEIYTQCALHDKNAKVQAYTLLNLAGPEAVKRADSFTYADGESKENVKDLLAKFDELCLPQTNVSMERHLFFTRDQRPGESVEAYIADLRSKARTCQFDNLEEDLIRDRFISGVNSEPLRRVLLKEAKLTLKRTIEIAQLDEVTQSRLKQFNKQEVNAVSSSFKDKPPPSKKPVNKCDRCGKLSHPKGHECWAKQATCHKCRKKGHIAPACRSKAQQPTQQHSKPKQVHEVFNETLSDSVVIDSVDHDSDWDKTEAHIDLSIFAQPTQIKVDTGAKCNIMARATLSMIANKRGKVIHVDSKKSVQLVAFGGSTLSSLGATTLPCKFGDKEYPLEFQVVDRPVQSLLGYKDAVRLGCVALSAEVYELNAITEYDDLFQTDAIGHLPVKCTFSTDPSVPPVVRPARRIPVAMKDKVKSEIDAMQKQGIISPVKDPTPWVSSMVAAKKRNGDIRICIDPRDLNKALKRPHHPLQTVDDIMKDIQDAKVFSVIDAKNGFWNIPLDEQSSLLTTFATPFGRYKFNRLPYGVVIGSEVYQQTMDELFQGLPCKIIVDDILVWGKDKQEHDCRLHQVLKKCREINLKLNKQKCKFGVEAVKYVGHIFCKSGVKPDPEKVKAISQFPVPSDVPSLQRFLGMTNYLGKFIPNYSQLTAPMRQLMHKDIEFIWTDEQNNAFTKLKDAIVSATTIAYFDVNKDITIQCDASKDGVGAVLMQDGHPIHFISRAMTEVETRYAQIEKELLAVVVACEKFRDYIYGKHVVVESDHKPLTAILQKPIAEAPMRLQRMLMRLQHFDISIVHKPGKEMYIADALSRAYQPFRPSDLKNDDYEVLTVLPISSRRKDELRSATAADLLSQQIIHYVQNGWPDNKDDLPKLLRPFLCMQCNIIIDDGIIMIGQRAFVPKALQREYLKQLHSAHMSVEATKRRAKECVYWNTINTDIEQFVNSCQTCNANKPNHQKEDMILLPIPELPFQIVAADLFQWHGKQYLVIVDSYSGWFDVHELADISSSSVIRKMKRQFAIHGIPQELYTDRGGQFTSIEFAEFCRAWDMSHKMSSSIHHQSNGLAERAVRSCKELLQKSFEGNSDFFLALLNARNVPRRGDLGSPAQRLLSRSTRTLLPFTPEVKVIPDVKDKLHRSRLQNKKVYDGGSKNLPDLRVGDPVRLKTEKGWKKKGLVVEINPQPRSYTILSDGRKVIRNRRYLRFDSQISQDYPLEDFVPTHETPTHEFPIATHNNADLPPAPYATDRPPEQPYMTRSGRAVHRPRRYNDCV